MADPGAYDGNFPVALTPAERAEMERRIALEKQMTPLEELAASLPGFAGHWIDQPGGGVIKVALVDGTDVDSVRLQALVPPGARLEIVPARFTLSDLEAIHRQIKEDVDELQARGNEIGLFYIHPQTNGVRVGVSSDQKAALAALQGRYGDAVSVEVADPVTTACTDRNHCAGPPLRAGIAAPTNAAIPCSLGFLIRKSGVEGWLTAGHCAKTIGAVWYHNGIGIGTIRATCYPACQYSDAARAGELNTTYSANRVYAPPAAYPNGRLIHSSMALNADDPQDYVCLNARRAEGWRCGYIQSVNATVCYERDVNGNCTVWFDEQRLANFANKNGDSGGGVHTGVTGGGVYALGIESGCTYMPDGDTCSGWGIYSHIARVISELGGWQVCSSVFTCE